MAFIEFEGEAKDSEHQQVHIGAIDHFTVVAKLPGLRMEARLPVTLF